MSKKGRYDMVGRFNSEREMERAYNKQIRELKKQGVTMIPCVCLACGGEGMAIDRANFDFNGNLLDCRCMCGGVIRRIDYLKRA